MRNCTIFLFLLMTGFAVEAQSIFITGSTWDLPAPSSLITKGGKNYENFETSPANQTYLNVSALVTWTVSVKQIVGANWDPALKLLVRRTGNGSGLPIITGTTNYIELTTVNQPFFSGLLSLTLRENIPVQYQIQGLSVLLPAKTYSTTVQYTIIGL